MAIKVNIKDIDKTCNNRCKCDNWLTHWIIYASKPAVFCAEDNCREMKNLKGVLVEKEGSEDLYVVPLCMEHSKKRGSININDYTILVKADIVYDKVL